MYAIGYGSSGDMLETFFVISEAKGGAKPCDGERRKRCPEIYFFFF